MKDVESAAAFIVCPMCDEKKCVGRYKCKDIENYIKRSAPKDGDGK